jgi:hypothetical protein
MNWVTPMPTAATPSTTSAMILGVSLLLLFGFI